MKLRKLFILLLIFFIPFKSYAKEYKPKVYLIVINKLTLKDIETMDNLISIINHGSIGLMNTRGVSSYNGVESFLTINSSNKTHGNYGSIDFQKNGYKNSIINNSLYKLISFNKDNKYSPSIGAIGDNVHSIGLKTAIYGNSDLVNNPLNTAALIPMDSTGLVDYANIDDITIEDKSYPFLIKTDYLKLLNETLNSKGDFIVVDTGDLDRIFRHNEYLSDMDYYRIRLDILLEIDLFIKNISESIDSSNSLLIITSPNSGDSRIDNNKLSPIILWGKNIRNNNLTSKTTNRQGVISNLDIGPTIMNFLGTDAVNMSGNPINTVKGDLNLEEIIKESKRINIVSKIRYNMLYTYGIISMILLALPIVLIVGKIKFTKKITEIIKFLLVSLFFIPSVFISVSVMKADILQSYILIFSSLILLAIVVAWFTRHSNRQILYISLFTTLLILLDLLSKGVISRYSVLSYDPIIGARYYGIGNEMVGLLLGSITILSIELMKIRNKIILPFIIFGAFSILVGHNSFGANFGGSMALIIAFASYLILISNNKFTYKSLGIPLLLIIVFISILGFIDIKLSKNITHLGISIINIKNNGLNYLYDIILRKGLMNIKLIGRSFWTYLLILHIVIHGFVFDFSNSSRNKLILIIAGIAGSLGGLLLNDSGIILGSISMNIITIGLYIESIKAR